MDYIGLEICTEGEVPSAPHAVNWIGVLPFAITVILFFVALKTGKIQGTLSIGQIDRAKNAPDYWAAMFVGLLLVLVFGWVAFLTVKCAFPNLCPASW